MFKHLNISLLLVLYITRTPQSKKNLIEMSAVYLTLEKKRTPEINERKQMRCNFFHHEVVFGMYAVNFSGAHVLI